MQGAKAWSSSPEDPSPKRRCKSSLKHDLPRGTHLISSSLCTIRQAEDFFFNASACGGLRKVGSGNDEYASLDQSQDPKLSVESQALLGELQRVGFTFASAVGGKADGGFAMVMPLNGGGMTGR